MKMTEYEISVHKELLLRIKKVCSEAMLKNTDTPDGQAAFKRDLKHICHTARVIGGQLGD